jgi:hypothetical protein
VSLLLAGRGDVAAQATWDRAVTSALVRERVIGLLNLGDLVGGGCGRAESRSIDMYDGPSAASRRIGWLEFRVTDRTPDGASCGSAEFTIHPDGGRADEQLPTEESGYEVQAAVVYERDRDWYRIAIQNGSAWVRRESADDFAAYPEILVGSSSYIRQGWDGRLWQLPGEREAAIPASWMAILGRDVNVEVIGFRQVRGVRWVQVRIATEVCGRTYEGVSATTGWIPAYRSSGEPSLWFYSRGC